jgi:F0F1-type ATP synthase membrane subunit c/vacuolar-type H+-ATPase subunit K
VIAPGVGAGAVGAGVDIILGRVIESVTRQPEVSDVIYEPPINPS